ALLAVFSLFLQTPRGTLRIEVNDPDIKVVVDKGQATIEGAGSREIHLAAGEHGLCVQRGDLEFYTDQFLLRKGAQETLRVQLLAGKVQVVHGSEVIGEKALQPATEVPKPAGPVLGKYALRFLNPGDFVQTPVSFAGTGDFTLEAWVMPHEATGFTT